MLHKIYERHQSHPLKKKNLIQGMFCILFAPFWTEKDRNQLLNISKQYQDLALDTRFTIERNALK